MGVAELGYGDGDEATVVGFVDTDPLTAGVQKNVMTIYFRHIFEIDEFQVKVISSGLSMMTLP